MSEPNVQVARNHVTVGEYWLKEASALNGKVGAALTTAAASMATAHFTASMAITNLLLADPAEAPEVVER